MYSAPRDGCEWYSTHTLKKKIDVENNKVLQI